MLEFFLIVHGELIRAGALVLCLCLGPLIHRYSVGRARARSGRKQRDELGVPQGPLKEELVGDVVTLTGRLVAYGKCPRFEDGRQVAAATVVSRRDARDACTIRAGSVALEVDDELVEIEGPLEVKVGSDETWPMRSFGQLWPLLRYRVEAAGELHHDDSVVLRSLSEGDFVRARGVLAAGTDEVELGYRAGAVTWRLLPEPHGRDANEVEGLPWVALAAESPKRSVGFGAPVPVNSLIASVVSTFAIPLVVYLLVFVSGGQLIHSETCGEGESTLCMLAAATYSREAALERISSASERRALDGDLSSIDVLVASSRVTSTQETRRTIRRLVNAGSLEAAERIARASEDSTALELVQRAWLTEGDFDRARRLASALGASRASSSTSRRARTLAPSRQRMMAQLAAPELVDLQLDQSPDELTPSPESTAWRLLVSASQLTGRERLDLLESCEACDDEQALLSSLLRFEALLELDCPDTLCEDVADEAVMEVEARSEWTDPLRYIRAASLLAGAPPGLLRRVAEAMRGMQIQSDGALRLRAELLGRAAGFALLADDLESAHSLSEAARRDAGRLCQESPEDEQCRARMVEPLLALDVALRVSRDQLESAEALLDEDSTPISDGLRRHLEQWLDEIQYPEVNSWILTNGRRSSLNKRNGSSVSPVALSSSSDSMDPAVHSRDVVIRHPSALGQSMASFASSDCASSRRDCPGNRLLFPYDELLWVSRDLAVARAVGAEVRIERRRAALERFAEALLRPSTSVSIHIMALELQDEQLELEARERIPVRGPPRGGMASRAVP